MKWIVRSLIISCLAAAIAFCVTSCRSNSGQPGVEESVRIATEAYIYGYPLVTVDMTRKRFTNVAVPDDSHAPMGQLIKLRAYPAVENHAVTAPNADTLYTTAFMDVTREPWILSVPDMGNRYFLLPMLSGWTDVFEVPGTRTTGSAAAKYAITGPGWSGKLPDGVKELKSPTGMVWLLGRIYCTGTPEDYKAVHELQDKFELVPLSSYGKTYTPPLPTVDNNLDMKTAVRDQVDDMGINEYFTYLARLMKDNPPAAADAPLISDMAKIGLVPGQDFDPSKLSRFDQDLVRAVPKIAQARIMEHFKQLGKPINGWIFTTKAGTYGTDYLQRATITAIGLGANRPQDAVYPTGDTDANGDKFDADEHNYVMHFDKGQMPPAKAFWSVTMYDASYFFVPNSIHRYNVSARNKFVTNPDGSVDIYIQAQSPGGAREANWLPAPKGRFVLMMRLYYPSETPPSIVDGTWKPPVVVPAK